MKLSFLRNCITHSGPTSSVTGKMKYIVHCNISAKILHICVSKLNPNASADDAPTSNAESISAISAAADDQTLSMVSAANNMTFDKYCEIFLAK